MMDEAGSATGPRNPPQGHGLIVQTEMTQADGHAERKAALAMIHRHSPGSTRRLTLGADKEYDCADFVSDLRQACVTPHVAQKVRHSAVDGRTTPCVRVVVRRSTFLYFSSGRDRTMTWDIHRNVRRLC